MSDGLVWLGRPSHNAFSSPESLIRQLMANKLEGICFGELRLNVITWNIANNDLSTEDVNALVRHSFLVSYWRDLVFGVPLTVREFVGHVPSVLCVQPCVESTTQGV